MESRRNARLMREMKQFEENPPPGISCWINSDATDRLFGQIKGSQATPYKDGTFMLEIAIPDKYPFEAPKVHFVTPIYHPNIDSGGRICLDLLKMPPVGGWKPIFNIGTVLSAIQLLMEEPNPDDPLMADIALEYTFNRSQFEQTAKAWTKKYAEEKLQGLEQNLKPA